MRVSSEFPQDGSGSSLLGHRQAQYRWDVENIRDIFPTGLLRYHGNWSLSWERTRERRVWGLFPPPCCCLSQHRRWHTVVLPGVLVVLPGRKGVLLRKDVDGRAPDRDLGFYGGISQN